MKFPTRYVKLDEARRRHGDRVERFGRFLTLGDPLADAAVAALAALPRPAREALVERCLTEGVSRVADAPPELAALFAQVEHVPFWVDFQRIERGSEAFLGAGVLGGLVLGARSLVAGYCSPAGNKPLMFSGRLADDVPRRLAETSRFVEVVSRAGGLRPHAEGLRACVKVRLMHASVRTALARSPKWNADAWGLPINQADSAGTLLLFSFAVVGGLDLLGHAMRPQAVDDFLHMWRYAGHLMGVDQELLCASYAEADALWDLLSSTQDPPDEDARALARALIESGRIAARTADEADTAERRIPFAYALSRYLIGDAYADALGYPKSPWARVFPVFRRLNIEAGGRLRSFAPVERMAVQAGRRYWRDVTQMALRGVPAGFSMPEAPR